MSEIFKKQIIKFLTRRDYRPLKLSRLAKALDVQAEDYPEFKAAFQELRRSGRVVLGTKSLVNLPQMSGRVIGTFRANLKGFGFVTPLEPNSHGDLFIPPDSTSEAMTGDTVLATVAKRSRPAGQMRFTGKIVEILERGRNRCVGTLINRKNGWIVKPDGRAFVDQIEVEDVTAKNAGDNDKVVVEILS